MRINKYNIQNEDNNIIIMIIIYAVQYIVLLLLSLIFTWARGTSARYPSPVVCVCPCDIRREIICFIRCIFYLFFFSIFFCTIFMNYTRPQRWYSKEQSRVSHTRFFFIRCSDRNFYNERTWTLEHTMYLCVYILS